MDQHLNQRLQRFIQNNREDMIRRSRLIISPMLHASIIPWLVELPSEIQLFCEARDRDDQLFESLLNSGLLPKYAFPIDVVSLTIPTDQASTMEENSNDTLQRDLKIAIAEYAPGAEIVRQSDQRTYKYTSVGLHDPFERVPSYVGQGLVIECPVCQHALVLQGPNAQIPAVCPVCASERLNSMTFIRPKGFTVDGALNNGGREPYYSQDGVERGAPVSSAKLLMGENSVRSEHRESWLDGRLNSLVSVGGLLIVNKGLDPSNPGFNLCPTCGRQLDPQSSERHRYPADVPPNAGHRLGPRKGHRCPVTPPYSDAKLVLAHNFHSEVLLIGVNFPLTLDAPFTDRSGFAQWLSFGTLVAMAASRILQIDSTEIKVGVRAINHGNNRIHGEVFLYDDVPGGAGYARAIRDNLMTILETAYTIAATCSNAECSGACYQCMLDYKNQSFHHLLSRDLGRPILEYVLSGQTPSLGNAEFDLSVASLSEYARETYQVLVETEPWRSNYSITVIDNQGRRCRIQIIHPLCARPSTEEQRRLESETGIGLVTFTTFDLIKRPFWALNQLRFL
ncbi:Zn-binding domain-containing protein [Puia sp. P3]|uniref:Zn-binding domain-containing protein n=1 Tax=Puia sp. P3 TaxID=3423952 RepID=UPI003D66C73C